MNEEYKNINGIPVKIYPAENQTGAVLAVHGFAGSKESAAISVLAELVTAKGLTVVAPDLPSHGERSEPASALSVSHCIEEIIGLESYIQREVSDNLFGFATSFGGMCMLNRLENSADPYKRIVFRVPAVDMDMSLIKITKMCSPDFSMDKAKDDGFRFFMGKQYEIPYEFYGELKRFSCVKASEYWNSDRFFIVWAQNDELVTPANTQEFLRLNPLMKSLCIENAGHRMAEKPEYLQTALAAAAEFLLI